MLLYGLDDRSLIPGTRKDFHHNHEPSQLDYPLDIRDLYHWA